jgi:CheY-like chemotaxis protein
LDSVPDGIDVLFTDIQLNHGSNGWDLAERFRIRNDKIGVVYASADIQDQSRRVSSSQLFTKPYRGEDVLQACLAVKI